MEVRSFFKQILQPLFILETNFNTLAKLLLYFGATKKLKSIIPAGCALREERGDAKVCSPKTNRCRAKHLVYKNRC